MKLIVDAQLPPSLATTLRKAGFDAVAVREIGLRNAEDAEIWNYAVLNAAVIVTKDEDFAERCLRSQNHPVVIWLRIGNATNPELINWLMPILPTVINRISAGDRLIEVH